jgi:DNA mismatch endonuclease (patch repair protein)
MFKVMAGKNITFIIWLSGFLSVSTVEFAMADNLSKKTRSYIMSQIRGKWTKQEKLLHNHLKGRKIRHKMHPKMAGNPDVIIPDKKIAIFLDGCFWHGCPRCYRQPTSNVKYWKNKIETNRKKDKKASILLRRQGWKVMRIWEHDMKKSIPNQIARIVS